MRDFNIVDLSHTISMGMPVYPGTEPPQISVPCTIEAHGFTEKRISLFSHTGTHIDAPGHILNGANTLDQFPLIQFYVEGVVIDVSWFKKQVLELSDLEPFRAQMEGKDFVLLHSGWSDLWGQEAYFRDYPVLSQEAALWLSQRPIKGIGLDMISIDPVDSVDFPNHKILFEQSMVIVENLTHLQGLVGHPFIFCCMPLKLENADGSPVRATAILKSVELG